MEAEVKDGYLIIKAPVSKNPQPSKTGKSKLAVTTNGFTSVKSDDGKIYQLSMNLIVK